MRATDREAHLLCKMQGGMPMSMGVLCTLTEEKGAKPGASQKYDAVLADLAVRAEIRAGIWTERSEAMLESVNSLAVLSST